MARKRLTVILFLKLNLSGKLLFPPHVPIIDPFITADADGGENRGGGEKRWGRSTLLRGFSRFETTHAMWEKAQCCFNLISRVAIKVFQSLISFDVIQIQSTDAISSHLDDILDALEIIHFKFTQDEISSLILHL
ncbi:hypothetical protein VP01_4713g1 [Puccinia sorghi]|uniref:Uncharacterized protein n=1 Tax=Puccinia sorghi TaxID=27349 RepID=A0A0L6UNT5_9BASI|nr:hypothetical protein VP01_4713g1 [Puccinia sorghi]